MQGPAIEQVKGELRAVSWSGFPRDIVAASFLKPIYLHQGSVRIGFEQRPSDGQGRPHRGGDTPDRFLASWVQLRAEPGPLLSEEVAARLFRLVRVFPTQLEAMQGFSIRTSSSEPSSRYQTSKSQPHTGHSPVESRVMDRRGID